MKSVLLLLLLLFKLSTIPWEQMREEIMGAKTYIIDNIL